MIWGILNRLTVWLDSVTTKRCLVCEASISGKSEGGYGFVGTRFCLRCWAELDDPYDVNKENR